jgi:glycosyltransferase involved in cell wall biosynthesis
MKVEVSTLLPVYNVFSLLEECSLNLSKQAFIDFAIIAIDDGLSYSLLEV